MHLKSDEQGLTSEGVSVVLHSRRALPPTVSRMFTRDATRQPFLLLIALFQRRNLLRARDMRGV